MKTSHLVIGAAVAAAVYLYVQHTRTATAAKSPERAASDAAGSGLGAAFGALGTVGSKLSSWFGSSSSSSSSGESQLAVDSLLEADQYTF